MNRTHLGRTRRHSDMEKQSDEYKMRRERNNIAVKKSRERTREKAKETLTRVAELKQENVELEGKVAILTKELTLLKDLLLAHASGRRQDNRDVDRYEQNDDMASVSNGTLADPVLVHLDHLYAA